MKLSLVWNPAVYSCGFIKVMNFFLTVPQKQIGYLTLESSRVPQSSQNVSFCRDVWVSSEKLGRNSLNNSAPLSSHQNRIKLLIFYCVLLSPSSLFRFSSKLRSATCSQVSPHPSKKTAVSQRQQSAPQLHLVSVRKILRCAPGDSKICAHPFRASGPEDLPLRSDTLSFSEPTKMLDVTTFCSFFSNMSKFFNPLIEQTEIYESK